MYQPLEIIKDGDLFRVQFDVISARRSYHFMIMSFDFTLANQNGILGVSSGRMQKNLITIFSKKINDRLFYYQKMQNAYRFYISWSHQFLILNVTKIAYKDHVPATR